MELRLANSWRMTVNEKKFIETALLSDYRIDGRGPFDYRNLTIQFGRDDGSSEVQLGQTRVMGCVTSQLVQPYRDRPNEGTLAIYTEFSAMADPSFEMGRPAEFAVELGRIIDRGLRESRAVDTESLCVVVGKWVWSIRIDLHILDNGGNLVDAANIAALAALLTFRRPECTVGGEDGQEVIIHPPEVREPLPLIVHHLPIAITFGFIGNEHTVVVDPTHFEEGVMGGKLTATLNTNGDVCAIQKAGGAGIMRSVVMQCLRIASVKAADVTNKIKKAVEQYNTGRASRKIKRHPNKTVNVSKPALNGVNNMPREMETEEIKEESTLKQNDDMDIETHSSMKDVISVENSKAKSFIGGPSSWDPYSKGINCHELRASLASRAAGTPAGKMEMSIPVEVLVTQMDQSPPPVDSDNPSQVSGGIGKRMNAVKTLKDAVKPKHRRKNKRTTNNGGD